MNKEILVDANGKVGSPPVMTTIIPHSSLHKSKARWTISSAVISSDDVKSVSQNAQFKLHPAKRMNTAALPVLCPSPCKE